MNVRPFNKMGVERPMVEHIHSATIMKQLQIYIKFLSLGVSDSNHLASQQIQFRRR